MDRYLLFDRFSQQALQTLHRYRAVMFIQYITLTLISYGQTNYC